MSEDRIITLTEFHDITNPTPPPTPPTFSPLPPPTLCYDYMVYLANHTLDKNIHLPIEEIDGVKCYAYIKYCSSDYGSKPGPLVRLMVEPRNEDNYGGSLLARNQDEFEEMLDIFRNYKFDKIANRFVDGRTPALIPPDFFDCIKSPNIVMSECCVCLDLTRGYIHNCKHKICMRCVSCLPKPNCPLCRQRICIERDGSWDPEEDEE
jgi:hypothetical protein